MHNQISESMNSDASFLSLTKKASSKVQDLEALAHGNPESLIEDFSAAPEGVWRTNMMIEEEAERHLEAIELCRMTSIEENLRLNSKASGMDLE